VIASRIGSCCFKHCGRTASVSKCLSAVCHCFIVLIWLCKIYSPAITMRVIASALATVLPISSNYVAPKCANFQRNMDLWDFYHSYSDIDSVTSQSTIIRTTSFIDTILMMCIRCGTIRALDRRMNGRTRTEVLCQDRASVILSMLDVQWKCRYLEIWMHIENLKQTRSLLMLASLFIPNLVGVGCRPNAS